MMSNIGVGRTLIGCASHILIGLTRHGSIVRLFDVFCALQATRPYRIR
jgi:hypothetical protein